MVLDRALTGRNVGYERLATQALGGDEEMSEPSADQTFPTTDMAWAETASRLLELQQKLDAWDRLYNEVLRELRMMWLHVQTCTQTC